MPSVSTVHSQQLQYERQLAALQQQHCSSVTEISALVEYLQQLLQKTVDMCLDRVRRFGVHGWLVASQTAGRPCI
jgi:uncharacterized protein YutE (UPF0331/DUF86 family)